MCPGGGKCGEEEWPPAPLTAKSLEFRMPQRRSRDYDVSASQHFVKKAYRMLPSHTSQTPTDAGASAVDDWLEQAVAGVDLRGVQLCYTQPLVADPWVRAFANALVGRVYPRALTYRDR